MSILGERTACLVMGKCIGRDEMYEFNVRRRSRYIFKSCDQGSGGRASRADKDAMAGLDGQNSLLGRFDFVAILRFPDFDGRTAHRNSNRSDLFAQRAPVEGIGHTLRK